MLKDELAEKQREVEGRDREVRALSAQVAKLNALLSDERGGATAAALAAARQARNQADSESLASALQAASQALRAGRPATAIDRARDALQIAQRLEAGGAARPDWAARARELLRQATRALTQRDWQGRHEPGRPIRAVVTLLTAPRSALSGLAKSLRAPLVRVAAPTAAAGSAAAVARLDRAQVDLLLGLHGVGAVDGGRREVTSAGPPVTALIGSEQGPGCLVRLRAPAGKEGAQALEVELTAWRHEDNGPVVDGAPLSRRLMEHVRVARTLAPGGSLLVVGVRSPFPSTEAEELLLLIHTPLARAPTGASTPTSSGK